jgi:NadR type nicotinamide-nucleotide adenylyltransferase
VNNIKIQKVVVLGGESTGKSTLCNDLATHYKTLWVPEYARAFLTELDRAYAYDDLKRIAEGQLNAEDTLLQQANRFLFCDTDLHVLLVWSLFRFQKVDEWILKQKAIRHYDAYILTSPDFPWQEDPLREHPEPTLRRYFFDKYHQYIQQTGLPFCIVQGNERDRLHQAVQFIEKLQAP